MTENVTDDSNISLESNSLAPLSSYLLNINNLETTDNATKKTSLWTRLDPITPKLRKDTQSPSKLTLVSPFHVTPLSDIKRQDDVTSTKQPSMNYGKKLLHRIKTAFPRNSKQKNHDENSSEMKEFFVKNLHSFFLRKHSVSDSQLDNHKSAMKIIPIYPDSMSVQSVAAGDHIQNTPFKPHWNEISLIKINSFAGKMDRVVVPPISFSDWMSHLPNALREAPLNTLYIPGSHDSFTSNLQEGRLGPDSIRWVKYLVRVAPKIMYPIIKRWAVAQSTGVEEQLMNGVRQFDFRVVSVGDDFFIIHCLYGPRVATILTEIKNFLHGHPQEIVFLDFQHFFNFSEKNHVKLQMMIMDVFGSLLCPKMSSIDAVSLSYLEQRKFQVLTFYRHGTSLPHLIWDGSWLPNPWPNTTSISSMFTFVDKVIEKRNSKVFLISQCVLTPSSGYLFTHWRGNLKDSLSISCNKKIEEWLDSPKSNKANIILCNFLGDNDWRLCRKIIFKNWDSKPKNVLI